MAEAAMLNSVKGILIEHADFIPGAVKTTFKEKCKVSARLREDLGFDNTALIELIVVLEESFNVDIPDDAIAKVSTVKELTEMIDGIMKGPPPKQKKSPYIPPAPPPGFE